MPAGKRLGEQPLAAAPPAKRQRAAETEREKRLNSLWSQCATILKQIMGNKSAPIFQYKVDPIKARCPDYYTIIQHPMWLEQVRNKLGYKGGPARTYQHPAEFRDDMRLIRQNCRTYNQADTPVR